MDTTTVAEPPTPRRQVARTVFSVVFGVLGVLGVLVSVLAIWADAPCPGCPPGTWTIESKDLEDLIMP